MLKGLGFQFLDDDRMFKFKEGIKIDVHVQH